MRSRLLPALRAVVIVVSGGLIGLGASVWAGESTRPHNHGPLGVHCPENQKVLDIMTYSPVEGSSPAQAARRFAEQFYPGAELPTVEVAGSSDPRRPVMLAGAREPTAAALAERHGRGWGIDRLVLCSGVAYDLSKEANR